MVRFPDVKEVQERTGADGLDPEPVDPNPPENFLLYQVRLHEVVQVVADGAVVEVDPPDDFRDVHLQLPGENLQDLDSPFGLEHVLNREPAHTLLTRKEQHHLPGSIATHPAGLGDVRSYNSNKSLISRATLAL